MKFALVSDLHQEFMREKSHASDSNTRFHLGESLPDEVDLVVIAGDLDVNLAPSLRRIADELPDRRVIYVPGNHDFYNLGDALPQTMSEMIDEGRQLADELGIDLMMDDVIEIEGVRFIGATLWTDMESVGRGHKAGKMSEAGGRFGMNDYRRMKRWSTKNPGKRKPMTPKETVAAHTVSRAFIERTLAIPFDGTSVVVTHHAPHPLSLDPKHSSLNWCYASNLSLVLESDHAPDTWIHGHIHLANDYVVGGTRVVANPRGYAFGIDNDLDNGFDPEFMIEIGDYSPKPGR